MTDGVNFVYESVDRAHAGEPAATRRQLVAGTAGVLGGMGLFSMLPEIARASHATDPQEVLDVAATAEVLATVINTIGHERGLGGDQTTRDNIAAAAREELVHFQVLTSSAVGGRESTRRVWVPDAVFASRESFLNAVEAGDTIFVNAYLIAVTTFGNDGNGRLARIASEFMGVELVHRALARQSLGKLGNDRAFAKYSNPEEAQDSPLAGAPGFRRIASAITALQSRGIGFGEQGATPGAFYDFDQVSARTPDPAGVNTRAPR
jgi:hypothetical protein